MGKQYMAMGQIPRVKDVLQSWDVVPHNYAGHDPANTLHVVLLAKELCGCLCCRCQTIAET